MVLIGSSTRQATSFVDKNGYRWVYAPDHPLANKQGFALEHRMIMHDAEGLCKGWHVHHRNRDKLDNRLENLVQLKPGDHMRQHGIDYDRGYQSTRKGARYPIEILTPDEARGIIAACSTRSRIGTRNAALFTVLYRSGLRVSEALDLTPKDLNLPGGTITVLHGKNNKRRLVGIDPSACQIVARWLDRRPALRGAPTFCTLAGGRLDASYVRRALRRAADKAGIEKRVHPHGLRHTHAAELAAEGVPANEIQGQLGHTSLQTTDIYLRHIAPKQRIDRIHQRDWDLEPA